MRRIQKRGMDMAKTRERIYLAQEIACLLIVLLVCLGRFANNPVFGQVSSDNGIFMCMGRGMAQGLRPYVDITENKGPLFFLLMMVPQLIVEGTAGVYVLELLITLGGCVLILRMARWLMGERRNLLCAAIPIWVYVQNVGANYCEEYDLFFLLAGVAAMVHACTGQTAGARLRAFWLGVSAGAVALIKISDILGLGVTALFYAGYVIKTKRCFWKEALGFFAGIAAVALPVFGYLWRVDAVGPMFTEYILNNFVHVGTAKNVDFWEMRLYLITHSYGWASLKPVLYTAGALAVRLLLRRKAAVARESMLLAYTAALMAANLLVGYIAGTGFFQHLMMEIASTVLAALLALSAALCALSAWKPRLARAQSAAALAMAVLIAVPAARAFTPENVAAKREEQEAFAAFQRELLPELEDCADSVYSIGVTAEWYWYTGLQPAYKYYNVIGFVTDNVGADLEHDFETFLMENEIQALLLRRDPEAYRGILTDDTIDYIGENYQLAVQDSEGRRLMRLI